MPDDIVENLTRPEQWMRVLFMAALVVALYVVGLMLTLVTVGQVLFSLVTGSDNDNLRALGRSLTLYVRQILDFLTYNSEIKPFPFSPYPDSNGADSDTETEEAGDDADAEVWVSESENESESASADAAPKSAPAPRKRSTRKKPDVTEPAIDAEGA
ncbi:MAG: DUF4389 domain-containing protein [Gammaproteobacteria bacterium]|nr:DUF4389 domain-containing protein [Gammaproteobacteria bacterium]